jgi:hypothetical protein
MSISLRFSNLRTSMPCAGPPLDASTPVSDDRHFVGVIRGAGGGADGNGGEASAPFTLLLLGNLRTFPLMLPHVARVVCQYAARQWLTLAVVAERVQHTDRSWWMKQV